MIGNGGKMFVLQVISNVVGVVVVVVIVVAAATAASLQYCKQLTFYIEAAIVSWRSLL